MNTVGSVSSRRSFLKFTALASAGYGLAAVSPFSGSAVEIIPRPKLRLGMDNFAVRAMGWNAAQLIDYAGKLGLDSLFITDLKPFANFQDDYLGDLRKKANDLGVRLYLGSWSICPTSKTFRNDWGTAEEHLALGLRMARALGSPVFRVVLGGREDRKTEGGIEARIEDTVKVCRACRSRAVDAGVKIAVENHAGDMQAWELVTLIEAAGTDYVGANVDAGNATWTLEDPVRSLEILAPYAVCTSLRDSMIWEYDLGAKVQWTAMGEGNIDLKTYFDRFAELCPAVPVHIETISGFAVEFPYLQPGFWDAWPKARAVDFAAFLRLAKTGHPLPSHRSASPAEEQAYQRGELERSIDYCRNTLGLGRSR